MRMPLTFPFPSDTVGVSVSLNEADIGLDHRAFVSDPESLSILEGLQRSLLERLGISKLHILLVIIGRVLSSLLVVIGNKSHLLRVVSKNEV